MKTKKLKLTLNKKTIVNLSTAQLGKAKGGHTITASLPCCPSKHPYLCKTPDVPI